MPISISTLGRPLPTTRSARLGLAALLLVGCGHAAPAPTKDPAERWPASDKRAEQFYTPNGSPAVPPGPAPQPGVTASPTPGSTPPATATAPVGPPATPPDASGPMGFFMTSIGNGSKGANFGGVAGADSFCQALADAAGSKRSWHAYLSTAKENARDRIGSGPWANANGRVVATGVEQLHSAGLLGAAIQTEKGGGIDFKNAHDILTGSKADGTYSGFNCSDYTRNDPNDFKTKVSVGHADAKKHDQYDNWNAVHMSRGCAAPALQKTAGQAHLYCFAID